MEQEGRGTVFWMNSWHTIQSPAREEEGGAERDTHTGGVRGGDREWNTAKLPRHSFGPLLPQFPLFEVSKTLMSCFLVT